MKWISTKFSQFYHSLRKRSVLQFGILLILLLLLGAYFSEGTKQWVFIGIASFQLFGFAFIAIFRTEFAVLSLITFPIGNVISFLVLGIVYFVVLTPTGLLRSRKQPSGWVDSNTDIDSTKLYE